MDVSKAKQKLIEEFLEDSFDGLGVSMESQIAKTKYGIGNRTSPADAGKGNKCCSSASREW